MCRSAMKSAEVRTTRVKAGSVGFGPSNSQAAPKPLGALAPRVVFASARVMPRVDSTSALVRRAQGSIARPVAEEAATAVPAAEADGGVRPRAPIRATAVARGEGAGAGGEAEAGVAAADPPGWLALLEAPVGVAPDAPLTG